MLILVISFTCISALLYFIHYLIFRDVEHIFVFLISDLAFLPLEVLLVTLVLERVLARREQIDKMQKLNMVIGAFFSEIGNPLMVNLLNTFCNRQEISQRLNINSQWSKNDFKKAAEYSAQLKLDLDYTKLDLVGLKRSLSQHRDFLLAMLANPVLLEHDRFTELLWALTHLDEELEARQSLDKLTENDRKHIGGDIQRMFNHLTVEWLNHSEHLKTNYPYLFSLVLRTHPFQEHPSPVIE
jgi:hypothetical protein